MTRGRCDAPDLVVERERLLVRCAHKIPRHQLEVVVRVHDEPPSSERSERTFEDGEHDLVHPPRSRRALECVHEDPPDALAVLIALDLELVAAGAAEGRVRSSSLGGSRRKKRRRDVPVRDVAQLIVVLRGRLLRVEAKDAEAQRYGSRRWCAGCGRWRRGRQDEEARVGVEDLGALLLRVVAILLGLVTVEGWTKRGQLRSLRAREREGGEGGRTHRDRMFRSNKLQIQSRLAEGRVLVE